MKHTVIDNEYGSLSFEEYEGRWMVHCTIDKWSLSLYKEYLEVWAATLEEVKAKGVDELWAAYRDGEHHQHFAAMFGFKPYNVLKNEYGDTLWVYKLDIDEVIG